MLSDHVSSVLYAAVHQLATAILDFSDADLGQPYAWHQHKEGVRFAILGSCQEINGLAVQLAQERASAGAGLTAVQHILHQNHRGFRDLEALLLGTSPTQFDQEPAAGEWPLRTVLQHIVSAERGFFTLVTYGLNAYRAGVTPPALPDNAVSTLFEPYAQFVEMMAGAGLAEIWDYYTDVHFRSWQDFAMLPGETLLAPSPVWWEGETYSLQYRLHRFDAHLQQHLLQAEKTADHIGRPQTEARRLIRLLYRSLAELEGTFIGRPDLAASVQATLAQTILDRASAVTAVVTSSRQLETAVKQGDIDQVRTILAENPDLVNATDQRSLPLILTALYVQQSASAKALIEAGAYLSIHSAAAVGDLDRVQTLIEGWSGWLNAVGLDGFTPLHLAAYFGQEEAAIWLIENGADVKAIAQNQMGISATHAAAACGAHPILAALLAHGADVDAQQQGGYTILHQAAHRNDIEMLNLCFQYGANGMLANDTGQTALDIAREDGHHEAIARVEKELQNG